MTSSIRQHIDQKKRDDGWITEKKKCNYILHYVVMPLIDIFITSLVFPNTKFWSFKTSKWIISVKCSFLFLVQMCFNIGFLFSYRASNVTNLNLVWKYDETIHLDSDFVFWSAINKSKIKSLGYNILFPLAFQILRNTRQMFSFTS